MKILFEININIQDLLKKFQIWLKKNVKIEYRPLKGDWNKSYVIRKNPKTKQPEWIELYWDEIIDGKPFNRMRVYPLTDKAKQMFKGHYITL